MTGQDFTVKATTFRAWYEQLEEIVAQDPVEVAPGNSQRAVMLLHDLLSIGLRNGAIRPFVTRSTGPVGFAHLTFRYPVNEAFDWTGTMQLMREPGCYSVPAEQLMAEVAAATGIDDENDD
jgi:hypothetical protein